MKVRVGNAAMLDEMNPLESVRLLHKLLTSSKQDLHFGCVTLESWVQNTRYVS
jgi:hypothetical protein